MDQIRLTALRDLAIRHLPRAQTVATSLPAGDYQRTLLGFAVLGNPNAPATEVVAAHLLQTVMRLLIDWPAEGKLSPLQRQFAEHEAVEAALELCDLTGTTLPWLADALTDSVKTLQLQPAPAPAPERPALQPGPNQTTDDAARYLGVKPQTMREWAMNDSGPLRPVKLGTRNGWPTAELIRLGVEGWKPRGKRT